MPEEPSASPRPGRLIVVGALGRMATFLVEHVLAPLRWDEIVLIDIRSEVVDAEVASAGAPVVGLQARSAHTEPGGGPAMSLHDASGAEVVIPAGDAVVLFGVQHAQIATVAPWLLGQVGAGSIAFDITSEKRTALAALAEAAPELATFGLHPLFSPSVGAIEGQTVVVCPSVRHPGAHRWVAEALEGAGAIVKEMSAAAHDEAMTFVQTASHQALLMFADVIGSSGLDIERDLWECRTPQFEALLALATRVLSPEQQSTVASIQVRSGGSRIAESMLDAQHRLRQAVKPGTEGDVERYIAELREPYSGQLFEQMQRASGIAITAMQSPRARLAAARRDGDLVGVCLKGRPETLRVGLVESLTATAVEVRNLLVGPQGSAALIGPYAKGARKLGLGGTPKVVELSLGNIDLFTGPRLEELLDEWLGTVTVDVQILASATIADHGLVQVAIDRGLVRSAEVVRDGIWRGRREAIVRCDVRADQALDTLGARFQLAVDDMFGRPIGGLTARARSHRSDVALRVGYLGPAGTFSQTAAANLATLLAPQEIVDVARPSFDDLLAALAAGELDAVVLPTYSSASGLVKDSTLALASAGVAVRGVGVVDVTVSIDAYVKDPWADIDGGRVASQSQALMQCTRFTTAHRLRAEAAGSTVAALERVAAGEAEVALAPPGLGDAYGLATLELDVGDNRHATTRFIVLASPTSPLASGPVDPGANTQIGDRTAWLLTDPATVAVPAAIVRHDEVLQGATGLRLWLSSDPAAIAPTPGVVELGSFPWHPSTPTGPS